MTEDTKMTARKALRFYKSELSGMHQDTRETFESSENLTLQERVKLLEFQVLYMTAILNRIQAAPAVSEDV